MLVRVSLLAGEESLAVLVKSKVGDLDVGGVDRDLGLLSVSLLLDELLNVDAPLAAVHLSDLALSVLVGSTHDLDGVSVAHGDGASHVLGGKLLAQMRGHHLSTDRGGGGEVSLAGLSTLARDG